MAGSLEIGAAAGSELAMSRGTAISLPAGFGRRIEVRSFRRDRLGRFLRHGLGGGRRRGPGRLLPVRDGGGFCSGRLFVFGLAPRAFDPVSLASASARANFASASSFLANRACFLARRAACFASLRRRLAARACCSADASWLCAFARWRRASRISPLSFCEVLVRLGAFTV